MADLGSDFNNTISGGSYTSTRKSIGDTAEIAAVGASTKADREMLIIHNDDNKVIYWGPATVTNTGVNKGIPIDSGATAFLPWERDVYLVADSPSADVVIQEVCK